MFEIIIPTFGRTGKQTTFEALSLELQEKVRFIIRPEEEDWFFDHGYNYTVESAIGVPAARQTAIETSEKDYMLMLDDDLKFAVRIEDWDFDFENKLAPATEEDLDTWLLYMVKQLEEYPIVGMDSRSGNNRRRQHPYDENGRIMRAFAVNLQVVRYHNIDFNRFLFWEDFHVALCLLKLGYKNMLLTAMVNDAVTNAEGGVSTYRDRDRLIHVRNDFLSVHAPYAVGVDKKATSWKNMHEAQTVPDLRMQWKKAYNESEYYRGEKK